MPGSAPPPPELVAVVSEVVYFVSLALPLGIGITVAWLAIAERSGGLVSRHARNVALPAAVIVVIGAVLQLRAAAHVTGVTLTEVSALLLAACGLAAMRWSSSPLLARAVVAVAVVAVVIPHIPLSPTTLTRLASTVLTTVHLLGAMTWVGGLVALAATSMSLRRSGIPAADDDRVAEDWAQVWQRFSIVALVAVGALIVSGTWLAWSHVGAVSQFITTGYGRFLGVKLILVLTLLAAGAYNVRILLPRIADLQRAGDTRGVFRLATQHFPMLVTGEAVLALVILTIVPFLRGSARAEAGEPGSVTFDMGTFVSGPGLIALVAAVMWTGARRSLRPLRPSRPVP